MALKDTFLLKEDLATTIQQKYSDKPIDPSQTDVGGGVRVALSGEDWNYIIDALGTVANKDGFDQERTYELINTVMRQIKTQKK